jgi:KDO2-lipid IV(A) lauroyltransferase
MNNVKYFIQYICIIAFFFIFKLLGYKNSIKFSGLLFVLFGSFFKSKKIAYQNIKLALKKSTYSEQRKIIKKMWFNYGRIFAEYLYINKFRNSSIFSNKIKVENQNILDEIKTSGEQVIFVSGHFDNFELMAMHIEKTGIKLAAVYRPLNNKFLNPKMESIRRKFICKKQIKKGISGTRLLLKEFRSKTSIAIMIDQRVSEGLSCNFFGKKAFTTTIPAQFAKKFNTRIVPIYIERVLGNNFNIKVFDPIEFKKNYNIQDITLHLNQILEKMILKNPDQWIWTHNRWKQ